MERFTMRIVTQIATLLTIICVIPTPATGSCELPSQPSNGRWKLHCANTENCDVPPETTELPPGSHLVYSCNTGYKVRGNADVFCSAEGNWQVIPACIAIPTSTTNSCELPPQPPNGRWKLHPLHCANTENCDVPPETTELPPGSHLVYSCNTGYKIRGNTDVICSFGRNWLTIPVCIAIPTPTTYSCKLPPQPPNGRWKLHPMHCANTENCDVPPEITEWTPGSHLVYSCNTGYKIRGNTDVICSFGRNWLTIPDCIAIPTPTTYSCKLPPQPPNGRWKLHPMHCANTENCDVPPEITEWTPGSHLVYSCNTGYKIRGNTDVICSFGRNWLTIPDCIAIPTSTTNSCELPPQPPNGRWKLHPLHCANTENCDVPPEITELPPGSHLVYSCNTGYEIRGNTDVICSFGRNWLTIPVCIAIPTPTTYSCKLPPQPPNGRWKLHPMHCANTENCDVPPEITEWTPGSHLVYSCNTGYKIRGNTDVICSFGRNWLTIPDCIEIRCKGLNTASVSATCKRNLGSVSCETPVLPGTTANLRCQSSYRPEINRPLNQGNDVICNANGLWEPQPLRCIPACGVLPADFTPLISGGVRPNITEFPWHASIYLDLPDEPKKYICGATIIKENLLVTAAHCVYNSDTRRPINSSTIHIVTGNIYRDYDSPLHHNEIVKKAEVKNIYIACHYDDYNGNYGSDIAILELVEPFVLSASLVPACIDLSNNDQVVLDTNVYGKVAGFGRTELSESSGILLALTVPYISYSQCKTMSKNITETEHYITPDKFCAGYTNGSSVCLSDSGSGLVFMTDGLWFLRGIASVSLGSLNTGGDSLCNNDLYSLFTRVSRYIEWIQEVIITLDARRPYSSCPDKL